MKPFVRPLRRRADPPTHIHQTEDEFFYVVKGEFKLKLGDRIVSAPAQSVMFVPRGTAHTFQNVGAEPGVILVGVTPGGFEKMFEERQVWMRRQIELSRRSTTWKWCAADPVIGTRT